MLSLWAESRESRPAVDTARAITTKRYSYQAIIWLLSKAFGFCGWNKNIQSKEKGP